MRIVSSHAATSAGSKRFSPISLVFFMSFGQRLGKLLSASAGVNLCALRLAARKPDLLRAYISFCLRKYDDLIGKGLPMRTPLRDVEPEDWETITVPAQFQTGGGTTAREMLILAAAIKAVRPR